VLSAEYRTHADPCPLLEATIGIRFVQTTMLKRAW
jgi:hypothetical protein